MRQSAQVVENMAPEVVEYFPVPQDVHAASPVNGLYLPAMHSLQTVPSDPVEPLLQVQSACLLLAAAEFDRAGHEIHVSIELAANRVE
jgi:hypothetical protein